MKENLKTAMVALAVLFSAGAFAQTGSVGINTTTPDPSAVLDVVSITKGILPPRMTNDQLKTIANPAEGLTAYNTTLKCLVTYINGSYSCSYNAPAQKAPTAPLGSTYTSHYNGIVGGGHNTTNPADPTYYTLSTYSSGEKFSDNTTCATKEISAQGCGGLSTVTGASGRVYNLVNINGQCWFKENLNEVPSNFRSYTPTSWLASSPGDQGYWGYYHTTDATGASGWGISEPAANEGLLYQWNAAMDNSVSERSRGICPTGFHIPSDCEWMYLEHGQGMAISEQNLLNAWRSNTADNQGTPGNKLRSQGAGQTNASGFSGLLAGARYTNGTFYTRASYGYWWSSSATGATTAIYRYVYTGLRGVNRFSNNKANGFSVRCLKD
jgi:uncharacterized protein (TIGR02145 family)